MKSRLLSCAIVLGIVLPACTVASSDDGADDDALASEIKAGGPALSPPAPGFCSGGTITAKKNASGCTIGFTCVPGDNTCPTLSPPAPNFCTGGKVITPIKDSATGCIVGHTCKWQCEVKGGACVGLSPSSCAGGSWAPASTHSCGSGLGVGCCIADENTCPTLSPPGPNFCTGGKVPAPIKEPGTGCIVGYTCKWQCEVKGGACVGLSPSSCAAGSWAPASTHACGGGLGVGCCVP
jgi:hypothetical protein